MRFWFSKRSCCEFSMSKVQISGKALWWVFNVRHPNFHTNFLRKTLEKHLVLTYEIGQIGLELAQRRTKVLRTFVRSRARASLRPTCRSVFASAQIWGRRPQICALYGQIQGPYGPLNLPCLRTKKGPTGPFLCAVARAGQPTVGLLALVGAEAWPKGPCLCA